MPKNLAETQQQVATTYVTTMSQVVVYAPAERVKTFLLCPLSPSILLFFEITHDPLLFSVAQGIFWLSTAGLWIRIDLMRIWIQFRNQGFYEQKLKKINSCKTFLYFWDRKLQFNYP